MILDNVENTKDYMDYCNMVNEAIEQKSKYGVVSFDMHKKVSDSFGDVYSKFANKQLDFETLISLGLVVGKMNEYNQATGNAFDLPFALLKLVVERITSEKSSNWK